MTGAGKVTVLGLNGHVGSAAARAFAAAGWDVTGFGRSNKHAIPGVSFLRGDAESVDDMRRAVADADVVVNALNLPYHTWGNGRMEAQTDAVIEAMGKSGKTLLFPGNIYNYAATERHVTPASPQHPETPRGEIRVRTEALLKNAAERGDLQLIILRAGDYFGPDSSTDWHDQVVFREAAKGRIAALGEPGVAHAFAYLPDVGRAFVRLAEERTGLGRFENFHFAGHFVTPEQHMLAIRKAAPVQLKTVPMPWGILTIVGLVSPLMREVLKMRYLWRNPMQLEDARLDALLGPDFATPFEDAVAAVVPKFFPQMAVAA